MVSAEMVWGISLLYIALLFLVAYLADKRQREGRSITSNAVIYALSIAVYATSWTFYGSVGKAATTGMDFILTYLGPSLTAFSWWFFLRKIIRVTKENNTTSLADFISSRYGKSQWLGALVTIISIMGIMPYIGLQLKAVSSAFSIITGHPDFHLRFMDSISLPSPHPGFFSALILAAFSVIFGARHLVSSERHEGLVAAIALESIVKLAAFLIVGIFVTYFLFDGFGDIFQRMYEKNPIMLEHLITFGDEPETSYTALFTMLYLSMGAIMFLPRQFQIMAIENPSEKHVTKAMWLFPLYMFLINIFVMPIALGGILITGSNLNSDYFVLTIPLQTGNHWIALIAYLGGFSAAAGMVMVESVTISTMLLNHVIMPIVIRLEPRSWFPELLINAKRVGIFLVVFLGYFYQNIVGGTYMLVTMGLISFAAAAQFAPAVLGGLYWHRGNKAGAITGMFLGFLTWFYTLLIPSFIRSGWWHSDIMTSGPFGLGFLRPTQLFGLTGFDMWSHSLFWSLFFNVGAYLLLSILTPQEEKEQEQARKFIDVFTPDRGKAPYETKRLSKPVTILQFVNLMAKFIGEPQAHAAISDYIGNREIDSQGGVSEFELPNLKRFIEKTLAGSLGAAAAGAVVESYLTDIGSKMESVYDIFSTVRTSLDQSREALFVRLRASEIMNRSLDLEIIMKDLLELLQKEFKFDLCIIRLVNEEGILTVHAFTGPEDQQITRNNWVPEIDTHIGEAFLSNRAEFVNDTRYLTKQKSREIMEREGIKSFAHIPIASEGEPPVGILSVFSKSIIGLFTEPFLQLLSSLAGQLAQAVKIVSEREAKEKERQQKEAALLENARVVRDMEIAKQIQLSLLPASPPDLPGARFASCCVPATHVGGDYYDFFIRGKETVDLIIADVSGHSVGAALIMVETRSVLRAQVPLTTSSSEVLASLNDLLYEDLTRAELFITMFYANYDAGSKLLRYANAGHNPPLIMGKGAAACIELDAEGLILGINRTVSFEEKLFQLHEGDLVLFYTDGIIEAQNEGGELFGVDRLCLILKNMALEEPDRIMRRVLAEVTRFAGSKPLEDDISMIIMRID
ncbi:SpoIIE family protein phosphatase [Geotalea sp. SG265]|uniref:SpoIIE family protein phosphatase n=1 Tax=Geotalea sp. SG265 TaxID=2922867 RepID=UPI001FAFB5FB|nr:SpoIIE family protein phosphatase [Geotalea sp. SG265]